MSARSPRRINARHIESRFDNESFSFRSLEDNVKMTKMRQKAREAAPTPKRTKIYPVDAEGRTIKPNWRAPNNPRSKLGPSNEKASPAELKMLNKSRRKSERRRREQIRNPFKNTEPILFEDGRNWPGHRT